MFQMGRCKQATAMAGQTIMIPAATKTIFSLRNLCGQGKGAGREGRSRVAREREISGAGFEFLKLSNALMDGS